MTDRAPVYHDPDIRLRHLLERYHRAGRARRQLSRRHDGFGAAAGVGRVGSVRALHATYRRYRAHGAGRGRAAAYLGLRVLGLVVFAVGMARGA